MTLNGDEATLQAVGFRFDGDEPVFLIDRRTAMDEQLTYAALGLLVSMLAHGTVADALGIPKGNATVNLSASPDKVPVPLRLLGDRQLPPNAVGLFIRLCCEPVGTRFSARDLLRPHHGDGRDGVLAAAKRLADVGWIVPIYGKARIPAELRMAVLKRDGFRCVHCGTTEDLTAGHLIPERRGGPMTFENLQAECRSCNGHKGARPDEEVWR